MKAAYAARDWEGVTKQENSSCKKGVAPAMVGARFYKSIALVSAFIKTVLLWKCTKGVAE